MFNCSFRPVSFAQNEAMTAPERTHATVVDGAERKEQSRFAMRTETHTLSCAMMSIESQTTRLMRRRPRTPYGRFAMRAVVKNCCSGGGASAPCERGRQGATGAHGRRCGTAEAGGHYGLCVGQQRAPAGNERLALLRSQRTAARSGQRDGGSHRLYRKVEPRCRQPYTLHGATGLQQLVGIVHRCTRGDDA